MYTAHACLHCTNWHMYVAILAVQAEQLAFVLLPGLLSPQITLYSFSHRAECLIQAGSVRGCVRPHAWRAMTREHGVLFQTCLSLRAPRSLEASIVCAHTHTCSTYVLIGSWLRFNICKYSFGCYSACCQNMHY